MSSTCDVADPAAIAVRRSAAARFPDGILLNVTTSSSDQTTHGAGSARTRPMRSDALRNRQALLTAAGQVFADRGLAASLDDIAAHAGVGVGTAYRHFASKNELIEALFAEEIDEIAAMAVQANEIDDPWDALTSFLRYSIQRQLTNRGLRQVLLADRGLTNLHLARDRIVGPVDALLRRAQEAGRVRPDLAASDIPMMVIMITAVGDCNAAVKPTVWKRYFQLLLDGIAHHGPGLTPSPLTETQVDAAMSAAGR